MNWKTHYFNPKTNKVACSQNFGITSGRGHGSGRDWTKNKQEVTCKKCLEQIEKWNKLQEEPWNKRYGLVLNCPECGHNIYSEDLSCPECGVSVNNPDNKVNAE